MIRGKILLFSLLGIGVFIALLGLAQMWLDFLEWELFGKIMITLVVLGGLASFLIAVNYDMPGSRIKWMLLGVVILSVALAGLILSQLWWAPLSSGTFGKLIISDIVLLGLISFILATVEDFGTNQKLKDEKYID